MILNLICWWWSSRGGAGGGGDGVEIWERWSEAGRAQICAAWQLDSVADSIIYWISEFHLRTRMQVVYSVLSFSWLDSQSATIKLG